MIEIWKPYSVHGVDYEVSKSIISMESQKTDCRMKMTCIGTGSSGNAYVLQNEQEALVIEAGMPISDVLKALNYSTRKVVGCIVSHGHLDHIKYIEDYCKFFKCYCSQGTIGEFEWKHQRRPRVLEVLKTVQIGGFRVRPIPAEHDAAEPFAYIIDHADFGRLLFATDTYYLRYRIPDMTAIMIECNYSLPILNENVERGIVPVALKNRTLDSHMSLEHLKEMLAANDLTRVTQIVIIHLSARNSDAGAFCREIIEQTGKSTTYAQKGLTIELNRTPF